MTGRSESNHHQKHHGQPEHLKSAAPQTVRQEGSRDKGKRPKTIKVKDAKAQVVRRISSLWKDHIDPLYAKAVIYQSELAFINRIGELLQYVEEAWKEEDAAEERAQQTKKELQKLRSEVAGRKGEDRKETEQKSDPDLVRLEEKYWSDLTQSEEYGENSVESLKKFLMEYRKANKAFLDGFKSITSIISKQDEEKKNQFLKFCENVGNYVTETEGKKPQDIQATLDIVNKAREALEELYAMCDAQGIQAVKKDLEEQEEIWSRLRGDEARYIEKSVFEEAEQKLGDLSNRAKEIEKKQEQKKGDAKKKLEIAMTDMQKLRHPSQKGSKKR
ncbi:hypothetical protein ACEPAI_1564 [Sanghuangporus weigelae]